MNYPAGPLIRQKDSEASTVPGFTRIFWLFCSVTDGGQRVAPTLTLPSDLLLKEAEWVCPEEEEEGLYLGFLTGETAC